MSQFVIVSMFLTLMSLMLMLHSGSAVPERLTSCCTSVSSDRISQDFVGVRFQKRIRNCVAAFIFYTEKDEFCVFPGAKWVKAAIKDLERKHTRAASDTVVPKPSRATKASLLSIITSTASTTSSTASTSTSSDSSDSSTFSPRPSPTGNF